MSKLEEAIPDFQCMLANKYFEHQDAVEGKHFYLTEKMDGIRCVAIVSEDEIQLFTRQGQTIEGLVDIEKDLESIRDEIGKTFVFDGELLIENREQFPSKEQYKQTVQIVRSGGEKHGIVFNVFDYLDINVFKQRLCTTPYWNRRQLLEAMIRDKHYFVRTVPILYHGKDTSRIVTELNKQRALNHEGVMINLADIPYQFARTNALLKVKAMQNYEVNEEELE